MPMDLAPCSGGNENIEKTLVSFLTKSSTRGKFNFSSQTRARTNFGPKHRPSEILPSS
jgi:hypothetical protein